MVDNPQVDIDIRLATGRDATHIADVHVRAWRASLNGIFPEEELRLGPDEKRRRQEWRDWFSSDNGSRGTWVAQAGDRIVGFSSSAEPEDADLDPARVGDVHELYVLPEMWGQGIGSPLLQVAVDHLTASGFSAAVLWVLEKNVRARAFYEARGWVADGADDCVEWLQARKLRYRLTLERP